MAKQKMEIERKKDFTYRGKTLDELKKLEIREFANLISARERRTILRNTEVIQNFLAKCKKREGKNKQIKTHDRNIIIVPEMVGKAFFVYNGREFIRVDITGEMLGHRIGEFSPTRRPVRHGAAGIGATRSSASRSVK